MDLMSILGFFVFAALFVFSLVFYKERMLFSDNAFQSFLLINEGYPRVMTNRWPAVIFRILPWLGLKLGVSLSVILMLFSMSFVIVQFICWWMLRFVFENKKLALLWIGVILFGTTETFYWCSSDLLSAIGFSLLGVGAWVYFSKSWLRYGLFIAMSITALFLHSLVLFPMLFLLAFQWIIKEVKRRDLMGMAAVFCLLWLGKHHFLSNWYDIAKSEEFWANWNLYKTNLLDIPAHKILFKELFLKYVIWIILLISALFCWIKRRQALIAIMSIIFVLGYILIIHIGNASGTFSFYREASYVPITLALTMNVIYFIGIKRKNLLFGVLVMISLVQIILFLFPFKDRMGVLRSELNQSDCAKTIVKDQVFLDKGLEMTWAIPFETLLISSLDGECKTIYNPTHTLGDSLLTNPNIFLGPFKNYRLDDINPYLTSKELETAYCK